MLFEKLPSFSTRPLTSTHFSVIAAWDDWELSVRWPVTGQPILFGKDQKDESFNCAEYFD
ncbi:hypothetical protein BGP83_07360 [Pseudomonas putida]|nr:hypothetical protein BGP83_07360 [Pseudomonas putida]